MTTAAYFHTARIDGVREISRSGSDAAGTGGASVFSRKALYQTSAPTPAMSRTMLIIDQRRFADVGRFPTRSSCGQLFVYVTASPGRSVVQAQEVQKKNAVSAPRSTRSGMAFGCSAYALRRP